MSTYSISTGITRHRRSPLGAAVAAAAVAGAFLGPAVAFAAPAAAAATAADRCTVTVQDSIGAGIGVSMTMGPKGPSVTFADGPGTPLDDLGTLNRKRPKLPASAGIHAEILSPYGPTPKLRAKTQGGGAGYGVLSFPELPGGCVLEGSGATAKPNAKPTPPATGTGQTAVVPKGPVAAGAEFGAVRDERNALLAGGAAAAAGAGVVGYGLLRRRSVGRG